MMTNEVYTSTEPAATLSEKELWALFVSHTMKSIFSMGPTVELYRPNDLIRDPGTYGGLARYSEEVADGLAEVEEPLAELQMRIEETRDYLANLQRVHDDFVRLKSSLLVVGNDYDEDAEKEPCRFHNPLIAERAA
ncbi:hypothetical protein SAMN05880582_101196 [Rhizobium sp. RU20A]|uniref:hypothetical protein n=1 Tax=Rhizobium sp. RU20A TaxID=1907412 RepID=UPI000955E9FF|nr:hypothetical protein [Rhizobium sp. RU20A]SIP96610.1 hypothetical protein SAMN05880582_101196 [Rhizobium sp. RU20A]